MTVGDGCGNPEATWEAQKQFNPPGGSPFMCAELYPGWLTHWGEEMANTSAASAASLLGKVLDAADGWGSANLYMAHGGTSFAWTAGANGGGGGNDCVAGVESGVQRQRQQRAAAHGSRGCEGDEGRRRVRE